jgi:hypothetical protein
MTDQNIAARIDALESRFAIEALISGYAQAFDNHDEALLRTIWHEDASLSLGDFGNHMGIDAIMASARANWTQMPHMHHWMANSLIEIDGDKASGRAAVDCLCTHVSNGPLQISGLYHDRYERREGRWGIVDRRFDMHFITPLANWKPISGSEAKPDSRGEIQ